MTIKNKTSDPFIQEFSPKELMVNIVNGKLFYRSRDKLFEVFANEVTTATSDFGGETTQNPSFDALVLNLTASGTISGSQGIFPALNAVQATSSKEHIFGSDGENAFGEKNIHISNDVISYRSNLASADLVIENRGKLNASNQESLNALDTGIHSDNINFLTGDRFEFKQLLVIPDPSGVAVEDGGQQLQSNQTFLRIRAREDQRSLQIFKDVTNQPGQSDEIYVELSGLGGHITASGNVKVEGHISASRGVFQQLLVERGVVGGALKDSSIDVKSEASATVRIIADTDNSNEKHTARLELLQDGGLVGGVVGLNGEVNDFPNGTTIQNGLGTSDHSANSMVVGPSGSGNVDMDLSFTTMDNSTSTNHIQFRLDHGGSPFFYGVPEANTSNILRYNTSTGLVSYYSGSTRKIKKNIKNLDLDIINSILNLKPKAYDFRNPNYCKIGKDIGFIAEEVAEVHPLFAKYGPNWKRDKLGKKIKDNEGKYIKDSEEDVPMDINWNAIVSGLVGKIQDLEKRIKQLENK